ncbi:MAG: glycosyltransferase family 9 protein, partial [Chloroflexota bacterium]|nr:glycosyltransferase family 9 protein [Chloroflexota bacterium]
MPASLRPIARSTIRKFAYVMLGGIGLTLSQFRRSDAPPTPARILIVRVDLLGDVLLSTAAVTTLRETYPDAHISMMTLPYAAPLAQLCRQLDEVIPVDTNRIRTVPGLFDPSTWREYWRAYRLVRLRRFDLALSLSGRMGSLLAFLSGARRSIGYRSEAYPGLLTDPVEGGRYGERIPEVEYVLRLARAAGATGEVDHLSLPVPEDARQAVQRLLEANGVDAGRPMVVIHAGSINGSAKRWPAGNWSLFAREMEMRAGASVVLVGAASDAAIAEEVARGALKAVNLVGHTTIDELIALLAHANLVATGDSGPLHLAVALGVPLLAVYGPTDPRVHGPYRPVGPVRLHRRDLPCSPCYT